MSLLSRPHFVLSASVLTPKAAVDLDDGVRVLDEGTARHHGHLLVDVMHCHRQPGLLGHLSLKTRRGQTGLDII